MLLIYKLIPKEESILEQSASENMSLTKDHRLATVYKVNFLRPTFSNVTSDLELLTMTLILLDLEGELDPRIVASVA